MDSDSQNSLDRASLSSSLLRGLEILGAFSRHQTRLGISDLAAELEMNRSTVHRYVSTLVAAGYLEQDAATRKYRLGVRVMDLGFAVLNSLELPDVGRPYLEQLARECGHTVSMGVLDDLDVVFIQRIRSPLGIDLQLHVGSRLPAYCTSMGKVLLADLPPDQLEQILAETALEPRGPRTITEPATLREHLKVVRQLGVAVNDEELAYGLRSIAAPVRGHTGAVVAAVNVAVHATTHSFEGLMAQLSPPLLRTTGQISAHLGFQGVPGPGTGRPQLRGAARR